MKQPFSKPLSIALSLVWVVSLFIFPAPVSAMELPQEVETPKLDVLCFDPPAGISSWWGGNNNPLDFVADNHGTLMNGASYADGMVRQAFNLDGSASYVALPDAASYLLNDTSGTLAAWVNPSAIGDNDIILAYGSGDGGQGVGLGIFGTVRIYHHYGQYDWQSATSVSANEWTFLAYTWDATTETIYKNGEFSESRSRETPNDFTYVPGHARLGHGFWGDSANAFPGRIDEPVAFSRTLSANEILAMYQAGSSGMCASYGLSWVNRDSDSIYHAGLDGSNPQEITPAGGTSDLIGLSHDPLSRKMYYTSYATDTIYRANPDGTGAESVTPVGVDGPMGIKIDPTGGQMYFVTWGGSVNRANLDGSNLQILIADAGSELVGIALDNTNDQVYFTGFSTSRIFRVGRDGGLSTEVVVSGCTVNQPEMIELDVSGGKMYWANFGGSICRANLDGSGGEILASGESANGATGIALDLVRGKLYWTNAGNNTLYRANLDGSSPENITPTTGLNNPQSLSLELFDIFPPRVQSITRVDPNPTFTDSVTFTVTFSELVTGVKLSDFVTHTTGDLSGVSVTGLSGSGTTYTVTVSTGSASGTLQLGVGDGDTIFDLFGTPLGGEGFGNGDYIDGETYDVRPPQIFLPLITR